MRADPQAQAEGRRTEKLEGWVAFGARRLAAAAGWGLAMGARNIEKAAGGPRRGGYTLIELLLVLAIMAILAATATPSLRRYVNRSKRAEAHMGLMGIYRHELSYFASNAFFGDTFDEIGFNLAGGIRLDERTIVGRHYTFTVNALSLNGKPRANFRGTAAGDIDPYDPMLDILIVENRLTVLGGP